jgi:hypothetical protein
MIMQWNRNFTNSFSSLVFILILDFLRCYFSDFVLYYI